MVVEMDTDTDTENDMNVDRNVARDKDNDIFLRWIQCSNLSAFISLAASDHPSYSRLRSSVYRDRIDQIEDLGSRTARLVLNKDYMFLYTCVIVCIVSKHRSKILIFLNNRRCIRLSAFSAN
jgi:hypothetical protein